MREQGEFRHLNVIPLLKSRDTFVVRELKEGETVALLRFGGADFHQGTPHSWFCTGVCHWLFRL